MKKGKEALRELYNFEGFSFSEIYKQNSVLIQMKRKGKTGICPVCNKKRKRVIEIRERIIRDKNIVEMSFKDLKMFVDIRPIRHWKEKRVLGHIFLAVLAFGLRSLLELKLRTAGLNMTAQEALENLERVRVLCSNEKILRITGETETTKKIQQILSK